jgi:hypothetical protein
LRRQVAHHDAEFRDFALLRRQQRLALRLHELELAAPFAANIGDRFRASVENAVS